MKQSSCSVSHYAIFDYWKDKCITNRGIVEIEIGYDGFDPNKVDVQNSISIVEDWGEPSCFACGHWSGISISDDTEELKQVWNNKIVRHELQKAHIIPRKLGGEDKPENLFCLCPRCHRDSPDTIYPEEFFKWIYTRRKAGTIEYRTFVEAKKQCEEDGINPCFIDAKHALNDTHINFHGGYWAESSYVAAYVGIAKKMQKDTQSVIDELIKNT